MRAGDPMIDRSTEDILRTLSDLDARARSFALDLTDTGERSDEEVFVAFEVCGRRFLALLGDLKEIIYVPGTITRIPRVQQWMLGLANVRGSLLPVVDLQRFLCGNDQPLMADSRVLVVERGGLVTGLLVPAVYGLKHIRRDNPAAAVDPGRFPMREFLNGAYDLGGEAWPVFDVDALVEHPKFRVASV